MIEQIAIAVLGTASVWMVNSPNGSARQWAPVLGLASQPFWVHAAWTAQQWGILLLTVVYTLAWLRGLRTHWRAKRQR